MYTFSRLSESKCILSAIRTTDHHHARYVDRSPHRDALTLKASPWRGIIATRSELDLADPEAVAVPAALLAWLIDS